MRPKTRPQDLSFLKKLNDREMLIWITDEIKIKKLIIIENKSNHFKSFYAPSLSQYELNRLKKESIENIALKPFAQKSLIKNFREQGILILYVNQSIIHLYQSEMDYTKTKTNGLMIFELKRLRFNFSPIFDLKYYPNKQSKSRRVIENYSRCCRGN
jgi:hypothetical protein